MKPTTLSRYLRFFRSFYFLVTVCFAIWMIFFDNNNLINQYALNQKHADLRAEKNYFETEINRIHRNMDELSNNPKMLEKFIREKYNFQRKGEDIYMLY